MSLLDICFKGATSGFVEVSIGGLDWVNRRWIPAAGFVLLADSDRDCYFGPAIRKSKGMAKEDCLGSYVVWADIDDTQTQTKFPLPPTCIVNSGHGFHYYWRLDALASPERIEQINLALKDALCSDSVQNINRVMRVPGTMNRKDPDAPVRCELLEENKCRVYTATDIIGVCSIDKNILNKILTGDGRGYKSRSERDWAIVRALIEAGVSDSAIRVIYENNRCGDKYSESGDRYLEHTIDKLRQKTVVSSNKDARFAEQDNCYYTTGSRPKQVSTFTLEPTFILEGEEDCYICNVRANATTRVWEGVPFLRSSFNSVNALSKCLSKVEWVWLGSDTDTRRLAAHLLDIANERDVPRAVGTSVLGRHTVGGTNYFVCKDGTIDESGKVWTENAPIMYIPTGRESPDVSIGGGELDIKGITDLLPNINMPGVIWPVIGWFMGSPMKPAIEECGYRFPILNVAGTRGSGKTTTLLRVFQRLMGYSEARAHDVGTTNFVALSLLGSSNAVPISFSEYRAISTGNFIRFVLLSYDSGKDARGRPDQTTTEYPLIAPISIDGEDKISDSACQERMIVVFMDPATIQEGSSYYKACAQFQSLDLAGFANEYRVFSMNVDVCALLAQARKEVVEAFPDSLPDRIRRNLIVARAGMLAYAQFTKSSIPDAGVLETSLKNVYSSTLGRSPLAADNFVEFVVNNSLGTGRVNHALNGSVLYFQLAPAYTQYSIDKTRSREPTLSREAIERQLQELEGTYVVGRTITEIGNKHVLAWGIDIKLAHQAGLDVPVSTNSKSVTLNLNIGG